MLCHFQKPNQLCTSGRSDLCPSQGGSRCGFTTVYTPAAGGLSATCWWLVVSPKCKTVIHNTNVQKSHIISIS